MLRVKLHPATIDSLAEMICGAHGTEANGFKWENFPYRKAGQLTVFFENCFVKGFNVAGGTRKTVVKKVLDDLNGRPQRDRPGDHLIRIITELVEDRHFRDVPEEQRLKALSALNRVLREDKLHVGLEYDGKPQLRLGAESIKQKSFGQAKPATPPSAEAAKAARKRFIATYGNLLSRFDELSGSSDYRARGYALEDLLQNLFLANGIPCEQAFTRNAGAEQIDGAFKLEGIHYLVECKWTKPNCSRADLDIFSAKLSRSATTGVLGFFLSVNGFSSDGLEMLKHNPQKNMILADGYDIRKTLESELNFSDFLMTKRAHLSLRAEPYLRVFQYETLLKR